MAVSHKSPPTGSYGFSTNQMIDISWSITEAISSWRDNYPVKIEHLRTYEKDQARATSVEKFYMHTGTHIDAPSHFLKEPNHMETITLDQINGKCKVLDFSKLSERITAHDLEGLSDLIQEGDILLFKTKSSFLKETDPFDTGFVFLDHSGAQWCSKHKIKAVGIDYLGIENSTHQKKHETHSELMENNIVIIEGLSMDTLILTIIRIGSCGWG